MRCYSRMWLIISFLQYVRMWLDTVAHLEGNAYIVFNRISAPRCEMQVHFGRVHSNKHRTRPIQAVWSIYYAWTFCGLRLKLRNGLQRIHICVFYQNINKNVLIKMLYVLWLYFLTIEKHFYNGSNLYLL